MAVTIHVNGKSNSLVHKGSMGIAKSTLPDVCKTPSPGGPVPIPYPIIISMSSDLVKGTKTVKVDGGNMAAIKGSEFSRCTGDEPGTAGGVKSGTNMKEATWITSSPNVKLDGKPACRLSDKMQMNHGNTVLLSGEIQAPVFKDDAERDLWIRCRQQHDKYKATQKESADMRDDRYKEQKKRVFDKVASEEDRIDFFEKLEGITKIVKRERRERKKYISDGCDQFDWHNEGKGRAYREAKHREHLKQVASQLKKVLELLRKG